MRSATSCSPTIAEQLRSAIRDTDMVCRIGGEEFAIIAPSVDLPTAQLLAERISARVAEVEYEAAGHVSVSVGVALGPDHAATRGSWSPAPRRR